MDVEAGQHLLREAFAAARRQSCPVVLDELAAVDTVEMRTVVDERHALAAQLLDEVAAVVE